MEITGAHNLSDALNRVYNTILKLMGGRLPIEADSVNRSETQTEVLTTIPAFLLQPVVASDSGAQSQSPCNASARIVTSARRNLLLYLAHYLYRQTEVPGISVQNIREVFFELRFDLLLALAAKSAALLSEDSESTRKTSLTNLFPLL